MSRSLRSLALAIAGAAVIAAPAAAVTMDGQLDPVYGAPLSTQTTQTGPGNSTTGSLDTAFGAELDAAYGFIYADTLHLFLAGNLQYYPGSEFLGHWLPVDLFFDSKPGGQHVLLDNNPILETNYDATQLAGLTFDTGFAADFWMSLGTTFFHPLLRVYFADLPAGGDGSGDYLGSAPAGSNGALSGGTNPFGMLVTVNDRNTAGVAAGCAAGSGAGVTSGAELAIPLGALGNPAGCVKVCAFVSTQDHSAVTNQALGPLPPGTCGTTPSSAVNFSSVVGDQFFTVCPVVLGVEDAPVATLRLEPPAPNPARGPVRFSCAVPSAAAGGALDFAVFDLAGRRVRTLTAGVAHGGRLAAEWDLRDERGARVAAGLYVAVLRAGAERATRKLLIER